MGSLDLLSDLCHHGQDHRWLWSCAPNCEFCEAVLLRLGETVIAGAIPCARCGQHLMPRDTVPSGARLGRLPVATIGSAYLHGLASLSHGGAVTEAPGLLAIAPRLRPADLLTHAAFGRSVAIGAHRRS